MQIKRDWSQPFFSSRRRRRWGGRLLLLYGLALGGFLLFVNTQFDRLQLAALDMIGMAPTPTPFASWWASRGYELFLAGDLEDAAAAFAQAVEQQPANVDYLYEYGRLLIEINKPGYPQQAAELGDAAIQAAPNDPRGYALKAKALVWQGEAAAAVPVALTGLELNPNYAPLHAVLARAYTTIGRYQQGISFGESAVELDPMDVDARRAYAYSLIWVGRREEAINELEDAVVINPNLTAPYFELAAQYIAQDEYERAVATYERVLSLEPFNTRALLRLCETFSRVGQDGQAQGYCEDALNLDPNYAEAYRQLGMVQYRRRNYEGAIENFNRCVNLGSSEIQCYYLRGLAHYYLGQCDDAWTTLQEALARIQELPVKEPILSETQEGLRLVTVSCPAYSGQALPTPIPPTAIPPTPLGGIGG